MDAGRVAAGVGAANRQIAIPDISLLRMRKAWARAGLRSSEIAADASHIK